MIDIRLTIDIAAAAFPLMLLTSLRLPSRDPDEANTRDAHGTQRRTAGNEAPQAAVGLTVRRRHARAPPNAIRSTGILARGPASPPGEAG